MSIAFIILFSFLNIVINIPSPIKIDSSNPFYITSNEILFEFHYKSEEKTDIIFIFKPYLNNVIYGKVEVFTNMSIYQNKAANNSNDNIFTQTFIFNEQNYITINSSNPLSIGNGNYFIYLVGNLQCSFEVLLINEIKILDIKQSYYFTNLFNYLSQNHYDLKIQNLTKNIHMNILAYNKSCSSFEITNNNQKIECDKEIPNLLLLEKNNEYLIKYSLDNYNYFSINFINFKSEFIQSLDELSKSKNFIFLSNSIFNYSINIENYKVNEHFGFIIDYPIKYSLNGFYSEKENLDEFKITVKKIGYNYFIAQKNDIQSNYFIFKIKFLNSYYNQIKIRKIDEINFINKFPFLFNIAKEKVYLFVFSEELLNYFKNYDSYIKLKFDQENSMNIYLSGFTKILKDKIFVSKIGQIEAISFINIEKDGIFEINMLSENFNELINSNYLITNTDQTYTQINNKGEKIEIIGSGNKKIFFCNLIMGDTDFYEVFDISENKTEEKFENKGIKILNNQTLILKAIINSYSIYEIFIQNYDKKFHYISNSKMIYFSKYIKYIIFPTFENMKIIAKLINSNSQLLIISNKDQKELNSTQRFIELDHFEKLEIEGNDSLIHFFVALTNNTDYSISNLNKAEINKISEIFIVPQKTNYDMINLLLNITQSEKDEIVLYYIVDYNIIPYSRNKIDIMNKITLKRGEKEYIFINNYIKNDKANHLNNETFYIYLLFEDKINLYYQLNYSNYEILEENNQILISPGLNRIFIGYEKINYLKFDKCGKDNISLDIYQNEEINEENIIISDDKDLISCTKKENKGYLNLEVNFQDNFLISLSHQNISILDNLIYNYDIELSIDNINKKVVINYNPVSNFPQIEYHIYMVDSSYYYNLSDHCFINKYINDIYTRKFMFLSNGEEEMFSQQLKIEGDIKCDKFYAFLIIAKEVINGYINYHYYNPKTIYVSKSICNVEPDGIYDTKNETTIIDDSSRVIPRIPDYTTLYFILGFDNYNYDINNNKVHFNLFLISLTQETFPNNISLHLITNYTTKRNLQINVNEDETIKSECILYHNEIKNQIKYECEFNTLGEDILYIKSLDIIELDSQKIEIPDSSFLHNIYKNNIQTALGNIFNKPLYILENSIINSNEKGFNITGNLEQEFNNTNLIFQFHPDKNSKNIIQSKCVIYKLVEKKGILQCIPEKQIITNIIDGYSNLDDGHLIVIFHNHDNKINMNNNSNINNSESSNGLATGAIIAIVFAAIIVIFGIIVIALLIFKKKENKKIYNIDNAKGMDFTSEKIVSNSSRK